MRKIVLSIVTAASLVAGALSASNVVAAPLLSQHAIAGRVVGLPSIQQARWRPGRHAYVPAHGARYHAARHRTTRHHVTRRYRARRNLVGEQVFSLAAEIIRGQLRPHARRYARPPAYYVDEGPVYAPAPVYVPPQVYAEPYPVYVQPDPVYVPQQADVQPQPYYAPARPAYVAPRPAYVAPRPVYVPQQVRLPRAPAAQPPVVAFGGRPHHDGRRRP